ncbi:MAG TPA: glycosyltransferase family 4 protein [Cyclobacteriaceae bacterium]|nr:glycosyltransferase family 4 protein [Cyclobacteriaceae bacterium]
MRIAQVAPLYESVPPKLYGGTERVVSYLTEELVQQGQDVTLFASGDSKTKARLMSVIPKALRLENVADANVYNILQLQMVLDMASVFDVIHYHTDYLHFPSTYLQQCRNVTTLHGRLDIDGLNRLYQKFCTMPIVSISFNQRTSLYHGNWMANIYHGIPENLYQKGSGQGGYAAFIGRISPEKRVDRAIEIAECAGIKLKIAAKIDRVDKEYFNEIIKPLFSKPHVEFIGEIGEEEKGAFLGNALVTLFPIDWPEPFGMVMIESLACGTPVIAYNKGSVQEVIDHGKSGFIVNDLKGALSAMKKIHRISREDCRRIFVERFTAKRMASDYLDLYGKLINKQLDKAGKEILLYRNKTGEGRNRDSSFLSA